MLSDDEFKRMRNHIAEGVVKICSECEVPRIDKAEINLDEPEECMCRCGKVEGICEALRGMIKTSK